MSIGGSDSNMLDAHYAGDRGPLFKLAVVTAMLTIVTLGIYRFWAKTRIRKYIWSSVSGGQDAFEYTGTGIEKVLGFLMAIVILAIYLGIVQMILFYFGLTLFTAPETPQQALTQMFAFYITVLAVLPLIFFAQYRARRYKMARTRWRGVRFGMEKGAWGYALRALGHWIATLATFGILLPWQTFKLEKYMTDRTWYGDAQFRQDGKWTALFGAARHIYLAMAILLAGGLAGVVAQSDVFAALAGVVGVIWFMVGIVSYRVNAFRYLTAYKILDGRIGFAAQPETVNVVSTLILGGLMVMLISALVFAGLGAAWFVVMTPAAMMGEGAVFVAGLVAAVLYVLALAMSGSLALVWVIQPVIGHVVGTVTVHNSDALGEIRQRAHDSGADAEGFADALDVGGAI